MTMWGELALVCVHLLRVSSGAFQPAYGPRSAVPYNATGGGYRFPDQPTVEVDDYNYFLSDLNFNAIPGKLLIGAADMLYMLNLDLSLDASVSLPASQANVSTCSTASRPDNPGFACHNHIRVYRKVPGQNTLLVCGTGAGVEPRCQGIGVSGDGLLATASDGASASNGIISYYPEFSQFGDFRNDSSSDSVFLSAGFFEGDTGAGRHFSISYKNITMTTPSDPDTLQTTELYRTINANNNWLRFPVTFVGSQRADYSSSFSPTGRDTDYQFWFLFLRENLVTDDIIYSRLVRVCRNDPGSTQTSDGARYFTTFMKARIFCERDKPSSLEFTGTLDYVYNSITSFVFSEEGRYYGSDAAPKRLLYGSFSGPSNGPVGSALCVYPADNSVETSQGSGRTKSVFDIFREDITSDVTAAAVENKFLECAPEGRQDDQQQLLFINPDVSVEQIGDDPILVLDDVTVTEMVQDRVCVVTRENSSRCIDQDILFLGLDSGRVLKVVFGTEENGDIEPIIAEDIELDPSDTRPVLSMELREINNETFLFVATDTRLYKLPLQRCARFDHCNCRSCVSSRDPYCMYNTDSNYCEVNTLSEDDSVPESYLQNIHSGTVNQSCDCPRVGFSPSAVEVSEGQRSVEFTLSSSREVEIQVETVPGTADPRDYLSKKETVTVSGLRKVSVEIVDDRAFEETQHFQVTLSATEDVVFVNRNATITITDNDGNEGDVFAVLFHSQLPCDDALEIHESFSSDVKEGLARGIRTHCVPCQDFTSDHIIKSKLFMNCTNTWSFTFQAQMLSTESANASTLLLPALKNWLSSSNNDITTTGIKLTAVCVDCSPPASSGLSSTPDDGYTTGEFVAVLVLFLVTMVIAVVLGVTLLLLLCSKYNVSSRVGVMLSSLREQRKKPQGSPDHHPPSSNNSSPQNRVHHLVHQPISYEQAQNNPYSSMKRLISQRTTSDDNILDTVQEEFTGFAGPGDTTNSGCRTDGIAVSHNTAYGSVKGDGVKGDGVVGDGVEGDGVKGDGVEGDGVMGDGVEGEGEKGGRENGGTRTAEDPVCSTSTVL